MKVINLNESQYKRLFEVSQGVLSYGQDNPPSIPEYKNQEEIGDDAKLHGDDGNVENQKPETTDKKQRVMSDNGLWNGCRGGRF